MSKDPSPTNAFAYTVPLTIAPRGCSVNRSVPFTDTPTFPWLPEWNKPDVVAFEKHKDGLCAEPAGILNVWVWRARRVNGIP